MDGAARGIGFATARALVRSRRIVCLIAESPTPSRGRGQPPRRSTTRARRGIAADVTDRGALQRAVATVHRAIRSLSTCSSPTPRIVSPPRRRCGRRPPRPFERGILSTNLFGVWRRRRRGAPRRSSRAQGHIVVISTPPTCSPIDCVGTIPYAMSKAARRAARSRAAYRAGPLTARASSVAYFGFIDTEMIHRAIDQDPLATELMNSMFPRHRCASALSSCCGRGRRSLSGSSAAAPRIFRPRRWAAAVGATRDRLTRSATCSWSATSVHRGLTAPGSTRRAGEDQPTTA